MRDFVRAGEAAERNGIRVRPLEGFEISGRDAELLDDRRGGGPGADHVHANAAVLQLDRPAACEGFDRRLLPSRSHVPATLWRWRSSSSATPRRHRASAAASS